MKPNPGGEIGPNEVVGRDVLISSLWDTLEVQSAQLTSERRIGKTSIMKKMQAEPREGFKPFFRDLENIHTPIEFAQAVFEDVDAFLSPSNKAAARTRTFVQSISGLQIQGVRLPEVSSLHWKTILDRLMADLNDHHDSRLLFLWDEIPLMLQNIIKCTDENTAMELLNTLRQLRQTYSRVRMVYTGSIGLHHVLTSLRRAGYSNSPVNDLFTVSVGSVSETVVVRLAADLMAGVGVDVRRGDQGSVAAEVAAASDAIPYYIHHFVARLKSIGTAVTAAEVEAIVGAAMTDPSNALDLHHYIDRVPTYYTTDQNVALSILDTIASGHGSVNSTSIFATTKGRSRAAGDEVVRQLLTLLQRDHYIVLKPDGCYQFTYGLIERYWKLQRGL